MTSLHTTHPSDDIKMLRETLSVGQSRLHLAPGDTRYAEHSARLGRLIESCEEQRPTGPDGKHGDRHTPYCGCEEAPERRTSRLASAARNLIDVRLRRAGIRPGGAEPIEEVRAWDAVTLALTVEEDATGEPFEAGYAAGRRDEKVTLAARKGDFHDALDSEIADSLRKDREYVEAHEDVTRRHLTTRFRALVSDWQANGNSRPLGDQTADVWQEAARQLLAVCDGKNPTGE